MRNAVVAVVKLPQVKHDRCCDTDAEWCKMRQVQKLGIE